MAALYALFQKAPELGSLIDPMAATRGDLLDAHWQELESRLEEALAQKGDEQDIEARVAAQGMVQASRILTRKYHLVITNPPYLGAGQHGPALKDFCEEHYKAAKGDLANVFLDRSLKLCAPGGAVSFVMPQNWLFLRPTRRNANICSDRNMEPAATARPKGIRHASMWDCQRPVAHANALKARLHNHTFRGLDASEEDTGRKILSSVKQCTRR